jgi:hypothetical protein
MYSGTNGQGLISCGLLSLGDPAELANLEERHETHGRPASNNDNILRTPCAPLSPKLDFVVAISRGRLSFLSYTGARNNGAMNHVDYS